MRKLELQVIWSGPYSYSTAPIEMVFAALKFGELNPDGKSTGKKALDKVAYMIGAKLQQTPKSTFITYWHATTLELFKYLYY